MFSLKKTHLALVLLFCISPFIMAASNQDNDPLPLNQTLASDALATQLGWRNQPENQCGGSYFEAPFEVPNQEGEIKATGNQALFSLHGTSMIEGKVTINRLGQQMTANKAFLYRDPQTGKLTQVDLIGHVHLREPNTLVIADDGQYNFKTHTRSMNDILYRTAVSGRTLIGANEPNINLYQVHEVKHMTAWGSASAFSQTEPQIYEFRQASLSTCTPTHPAWHIKASHIVLNKNTGRGYATHARIYVKNVPVAYTPYINFPIDSRRKTGFLWPTFGLTSNKWGPYLLTPFYWNLAPNYDMTITPGLLSKRGVQLSDQFRYLTEHSKGKIDISVLPNDKEFSAFQKKAEEAYGPQSKFKLNTIMQAELARLEHSSTTRKSFDWRDDSRYNEHWSTHVDFNYAGDDYYLKDFGSNLNEVSLNYLLQEADLNYQNTHWNFTGRVQAYQILYPIVEGQAPVPNQPRRLPQLILNGDYPDQLFGMEYFIQNELTHFDNLKTPGVDNIPPIGNRMHTQPGVSLPLSWPFFYMTPRVQAALTQYELHQTANTGIPVNPDAAIASSQKRAVPIFDVASGLIFSRDTNLFWHDFTQTVEPQFYYTYIPYRNQSQIPVFDTRVNTLVYDQLFNYNRFSGLDRIGDANQVAVGVTSRFIDQDSGLEKVRLGLGGISYFSKRRVTLCNNSGQCSDYPNNPETRRRLSPLSGVLDYHVSPVWTLSTNILWNPISKQVDNTATGLHYQPETNHIINLGYNFARNSNPFSGIGTPNNKNNKNNNLKSTTISAAWPLFRDINGMGLWSHDWNTNHFQNLLYGLEYDTCCWTMRLVGGRAFTGRNPTNQNKLVYNNEFYIQFALKGLGNIQSSNPNTLLSSINGYNTDLGYS